MAKSDDALTGIRLKRRRAWDQLNGLKTDLYAFLHDDPPAYIPRVDFNKKTHLLTVSAHVQKTPDPMWGVRIGEIVHDLRSALDHIVWELFILKNREPPPRGSKNQFAIFETKAGFSGRGTTMFLKGLSKPAIELIGSEQPFPINEGGTGEGAKSPLWHLKELSDADKHRTLHVTGTLLHTFNFTFPPLKYNRVIHHRKMRNPGPIQEDAILGQAYIEGATEWPFTEPEVKCQLGTDVAFDQTTPAVGGWLVHGTLIDVANRTDRILGRIAREQFHTEL